MSGRKVFVSSDMSVDERLLLVSERNGSIALLWPWLLTAMDDWGRCEGAPLRLKARIWPMNEAVSVAMVREALVLFAEFGLIECYEVSDHAYLRVPPERWWKWQTHIHRDKRESDGSRIPAPESENPPTQAKSRGDARDSAKSRGDARDSAKSRGDARDSVPSPSPSLSPSPTGEDVSQGYPITEDKRQQLHTRTRTSEDATSTGAMVDADAVESEPITDSKQSWSLGASVDTAKRQPLAAFKHEFAHAAGLPPGDQGESLDAIIRAYRPRAPDDDLIVEANNFRDYYAKKKRQPDCRLLTNWLMQWTKRLATDHQQSRPGDKEIQHATAGTGTTGTRRPDRNGRRRFDPPDPTKNGRWAHLVHDASDIRGGA